MGTPEPAVAAGDAPMLDVMTARLLVVEDDDGIALPLLRTLQREGYVVQRAATGEEAVRAAVESGPDLIILDLGLPDLDGLDVCRQIREGGCPAGILILTARGGELDLVVGLDVGADDYLTKPFALGELLARTRALLRRTADRVTSPQQAIGPRVHDDEPAAGTVTAGLRVDARARQAWVDQVEVSLTVKEFGLLVLLDQDRGSVLTREDLMAQVWDENWFGSTKTLDVTMGRLRQKLEERHAPVRIATVRGVGFRLETGPADA